MAEGGDVVPPRSRWFDCLAWVDRQNARSDGVVQSLAQDAVVILDSAKERLKKEFTDLVIRH